MSGEHVRTVSFEIDGDDGGATVVLRIRPSGVRATCTCGLGTAAAVADLVPSCAHVASAAAAFPDLAAALDSAASQSAGPPSTRGSSSPPATAVSPRPDPALADLKVLLEALLRAAADEVTTAVDQALRAAVEALAVRPLPGVARVLDRVSLSVGSRATAAESAFAITALSEVVATIEGAHGDGLRGEVLGTGPETGKLDDLDLVEVARARDRGVLSWETRLLVDVASGALYREEAAVGSRTLSAGVCGRRVLASLALRSASRDPPRIQLLQYQLEPAATQGQLLRVADAARKSVALPDVIKSAPLVHVACPLAAWIAPDRVKHDRQGIVVADASGERLALDAHRDPGAFEALAALVDSGSTVRALAGSFQLDVEGVRLQPWSALIEGDRGLELVPLSV